MANILRKAAVGAALASAALLANPASAATTIDGRITTNGTSDIFFNFVGGAFSVGVNTAADNGIADPELFIFRDNGSLSGALTGGLIGNDDDSGAGLNALFTGSLAAGNYVLSVGTFNFTQAEARSGMADFVQGERRFQAVFGDGVTVTQGVGAVPEPATWAMMLVGFGAVGFAMRRRKVATRVQFA